MNRNIEFSLSVPSQRCTLCSGWVYHKNTAFITSTVDGDRPASRENLPVWSPQEQPVNRFVANTIIPSGS